MTINSKISKYNLVYKVMDDYPYLISHASVSMAGGLTFGVYGAVIGFGISAFDDFLIYNNYTKNKSVTQSFIGLTLGYSVFPSWISGLIGVCGGIAASQNILKNYHNEIRASLITIILGTKLNGQVGTLVGIVLSVADQVFMQNNITNKYYFSYSLLGVTSFSTIFGNSILSYSVGAALGLIFTNYADTMASPLQSIELSKDLYKLYLKIIPQEELDYYIKEYIIVLLSSQIFANQLRLILLKHQQNSMYQFEHMDEPDKHANNKLTIITVRFGLFLLPYIITEFVSNIINSFYSTKLYIQVDDRLRDILFSNETALKMSIDKNNTVLIDNLRLDSKVISRDSSKLIVDSMEKSINGLCGGSILIVSAPEILVYSMLYNKATEYVSTMLAELQNKYEILIKEQESVIFSLFKHDMKNIKIITETAGVMYSYIQLQLAHDKLRENELIKDQILHLMNAWRSFESIANFISTYYLIGYKVGIGAIDFSNRINMHYSCLRVSSLLAWNGEKSQEIRTLYQSMERLDIFLNKTLYSDHVSINNADNIKRDQYGHDEKMLVLSKLDIAVANKHLIYIDYLELAFGNRYVLTGPSGSGKSSLITKIVGTINNNIGGEGNIYYPKNVKIGFINQQDYFPLNKNMEEIIFYPGDVNQEKIWLVQQLLVRVDLTQYKLDQTEDWYSVLSGGQKQKIRIISAIMQEPNVLILDEVFNGLDKKAIELMQAIIIEILPDILVISIDHSAVENNNTGFYTNSLRIIEGELIEFDNKLKYQDEYLSYELFESGMNYDQKCYDYEHS